MFESVEQALNFAFKNRLNYARQILVTKTDSQTCGTTGLSIQDAMAQAGLIKGRLQRDLPRLGYAVIVTKYSSIVMGKNEYLHSFGFLGHHLRNTTLSGCTTTRLLIQEYIIKAFSSQAAQKSINQLAKEYSVHSEVVKQHFRRVSKELHRLLESTLIQAENTLPKELFLQNEIG
jgi:hypothetical protein